MNVILVQSYVVHAEKAKEFIQLLNEFIEFKATHPKLFDGIKSWKLYEQGGQSSNKYMEIWEYENLAQLESINQKIHSDEHMKQIITTFRSLLEPGSLTECSWNTVA